MTLGRRPCHRDVNSSSGLIGINIPTAENIAEGSNEGYLRGLSELPPAIPNEVDRPLIRPDGNTHWCEIPIVRKGRKPSSVLTCILRTHHPGLVNYKGESLVATTWEHYKAIKDTSGHSVANKVEDEFWLRYRYESQYEEAAKQHVGRCCKQLLTSLMYYTRIQAIIDHFRIVEKRKISDKMAGRSYLLRSEYMAQRPTWCIREAWAALVDQWCHPDWVKKSETSRANRVNSRYKPHKGGSNSITTISQKLSQKEGREVTKIEAWVHTHRGPDPNDPNMLNTEEATECLESYRRKVVELNGVDFDWKQNTVDSRALYDCSSGKPHGKWALFNGIVNDKEVIAEVRASGASSAALKRHCAEQAECERRRQSEKTRKAEAHANKVLAWGLGLYDHCNGIQKLLENLAARQGVPANEIPPPPPPPPPRSPSPPGSPNPSPVHPHSVSSDVGLENHDPAFHAVAEGMFGGFFSATGSGATNFSSLLGNEIGPF